MLGTGGGDRLLGAPERVARTRELRARTGIDCVHRVPIFNVAATARAPRCGDLREGANRGNTARNTCCFSLNTP